MRVSVIINARAGSADQAILIEKIKEALFRCRLEFCLSRSLEETRQFISREIEQKTESFLVCGGDGTVNATLQSFMSVPSDVLPPIALIRSGTANDLAQELGISEKIEEAARNILEGSIERIDVIEVSSADQKAYMLTSGGLGIAALTAQYANAFREKMRATVENQEGGAMMSWLAQRGSTLVRKSGSGIYPLMLAGALRDWNREGWSLEFESDDGSKFETQSPIVLVNNQARIGANFFPAPYTNNRDGTVNLLVSKTEDMMSHLGAIMDIRRGKIHSSKRFDSYEMKNLRIRSQNSNRLLNFFGDGEILIRDAAEINIRCLHQTLPLFLKD